MYSLGARILQAQFMPKLRKFFLAHDDLSEQVGREEVSVPRQIVTIGGQMSKVLTDLEVLEVIRKTIEENLIDDGIRYNGFLTALGELVADHFGGRLTSVDGPMDYDPQNSAAECRWLLSFHWDENVPKDGGVYKDYDTDVTIEDWRSDKS